MALRNAIDLASTETVSGVVDGTLEFWVDVCVVWDEDATDLDVGDDGLDGDVPFDDELV